MRNHLLPDNHLFKKKIKKFFYSEKMCDMNLALGWGKRSKPQPDIYYL